MPAPRRARSSGRAGVAAALAGLSVLSACGVAAGSGDRGRVLSETCRSYRARADPSAASTPAPSPAEMMAAYAQADAAGTPFDTIEPFVTACRGAG